MRSRLDWMIKRVRYHYPDFPSLEAVFPIVLGLEKEEGKGTKQPMQHDSRKRQYLLSAPALRSIGNLRPRLLSWERLVSYNRSETAVGESIHISALERLGEKVPYDNLNRNKLYVPRNVLTALASLRQRYSTSSGPTWDADNLSVTDWNGEVVHETESTSAVIQQINLTIAEAIGRLSRSGVDLNSFGIM